MLKAVLFDLDGTLLPMDEEKFTKVYFKLLCKKFALDSNDKETFIGAVLKGVKQICYNDGKLSNEETFWKVYSDILGKERLKDKALFDKFYLNEFKQTIVSCEPNEIAKDIVKFAKNCGLKVILASNPVFPRDGMISRLGFIDLSSEDFDYITSYENSHYAKPNPNYYAEILKSNDLASDEVLYFGNSKKDDLLPASSIGIKTFLVADFCENKNEKNERIYLKEIKSIIEKYL